MAIRIGINGFGRIGRMVLRAVINEAEFSNVEVVAINCSYDIDYMAYMLKYDSVHGRLKADVNAENDAFVVNGQKIQITAERDPAKIDWAAANVDVVVDAGAVCVIQPGGSMRDDEVIAAADERGLAMVMTGIRHFRH